MGTSGRIRVFDCINYDRLIFNPNCPNNFVLNTPEDWRLVATIFSCCDSYLDGVGKEIKQSLEGKNVVNGISGNINRDEIFNTMREGAVRLLIDLYNWHEHDIDLVEAGFASQDYNYDIYHNAKGEIYMRVYGFWGSPIYDGKIKDFDPVDKEEDDEGESMTPY